MPARPKLSENQRREIARSLRSGVPATDVAERCGIHVQRVYQIARDYRDREKLALLEDEVAFRREMVGQRN